MFQAFPHTPAPQNPADGYVSYIVDVEVFDSGLPLKRIPRRLDRAENPRQYHTIIDRTD